MNNNHWVGSRNVEGAGGGGRTTDDGRTFGMVQRLGYATRDEAVKHQSFGVHEVMGRWYRPTRGYKVALRG